jgi:glycosyltransferase involved in cell wall biosynthesis
MIYGEISDLPQVAKHYDAVIATSYITVYWAAQLAALHPKLPIAYYIQDYEPYFDEPGSQGYLKAAASYTLLPNLVRCCTTPWIQQIILHKHQAPTTVLGPSLDIDQFFPRSRRWPASKGLRVAAMIRPSTPRRNPRGTMEILQRASREFGPALEPVIFGASLGELRDAGMPLSFPCKLTGRINQRQVALLMNEVDIFVDYSVFQGLGLTALEAMACGAAAVVPKYGGTSSFARNELNCLVINTHDSIACYASLQRLLTDSALRLNLGRNGISSAVQYYPELPALKLLQSIFPE